MVIVRRLAFVTAVAVAALFGGLRIAGGSSRTAVPAATAASSTATPPSTPLTRYSLVHGCYDLRSPVTGQMLGGTAGPFRMQATALGQYLLYGAGKNFLTDPSTGATASAPADGSVWRVDGPPFKLTNLGDGSSTAVQFIPANGCADYPEAQVDATGTPFSGASPTATVFGTIDAHTHITAFEFFGGDFHCGKPWDAFGVPYALPDCAKYESGSNGLVEAFEDFGSPTARPKDMVGWPTFKNWPGPTKLAEEGDYYTGIKRAWMAGVRVIVTQLVDNEALCELMTERHNPCNDMASVRIQAHDLRMLQDYIDAQSGGPGKGFFRIVTNPFQARQVVNSGKLAIVEGIEVSHVLNCGEVMHVPQCDRAQVDSGLQELHRLGVSTFFPVHKFDNAFGGTKMDGGETGVLVNLGNHLETGNFWDVKTCTGPEHDNTQITPPAGGGLASMLNGALAPALGDATVPAYPPPPHCNQQGLTDLGAYLINEMIKQHFIVELDHMDAKTADQALAIIEAHNYSGVISAHSWDSPQENVGIYKVGGFVTPYAGDAASFVEQWKDTQSIRNPRFAGGIGFGYGADMNGLGGQGGPTASHPIGYPFKSFDGRVTFTKETWGSRQFDLNTDGVANYGMYADWQQELQVLAGRAIGNDMFHGAETYLEMWERAEGVPASVCRNAAGRFGPGGTRTLRLGASATDVLYALSQPTSRPGTAYRYCIAGSAGKTLAGVFTPAGTVGAWIASAPGYAAAGIKPGQPAARARNRGKSIGGGLRLGIALRDGSRYVYGVRGGKVAFVGVVTRSVGASSAAVRAAVKSAGV